MPIEWVNKLTEFEKSGLDMPPLLARYKRDRFRLSVDIALKFGVRNPVVTTLIAQAFYLDCVEPNPVNVVLHGR